MSSKKNILNKKLPKNVNKAEKFAEEILKKAKIFKKEIKYDKHLLVACILHISHSKHYSTLQDVRNLILNPNMGINKIFNTMFSYEHDPELKKIWTTQDRLLTKTHPHVQRIIKYYLDMAEGERFRSIKNIVIALFEIVGDKPNSQPIYRTNFKKIENNPKSDEKHDNYLKGIM